MSSSNEVSLNVEETNKLRAQLGLKPLDVTNVVTSGESQHTRVVPIRVVDLKERLDERKRTREREKSFRRGKRAYELFEEDGDDDLDPAAWVEKMRAADKKNTASSQLSSEESYRHDSSSEVNLRIEHALQFDDEEGRVFTLKDKRIGEDDEGEDDDEVIENAEWQRDEQLKEKMRQKKKIESYKMSAGLTGVASVHAGMHATGELVSDEEDGEKEYDEMGEVIRKPRFQTKVTVKHGEDTDEIEPPVPIETKKLSALDALKAKRERAKALMASVKDSQNIKKRKKLVDWNSVFGDVDNKDEDSTTLVAESPPPSVLSKVRTRKLRDGDGDMRDVCEVEEGEIERSSSNIRSSSVRVAQLDIGDEDEFEKDRGTILKAIHSKRSSEKGDMVVHTLLEEAAKVEETIVKEEVLDLGSGLVAGVTEGSILMKKKKDQSGITPMSSTSDISEFCRSVLTPAERFEQKKAEALMTTAAMASGEIRRGVKINERDGGGGGDGDTTIMMKDAETPLLNLSEEADNTTTTTAELKHSTSDLVADITGLDNTLTSALQYLNRKGDLDQDRWKLGRVGREKKMPMYKGTVEGEVKIEHRNAYDDILSPKQAFRKMSWVFHGKGPGKKKLAKFIKTMESEKRIKKMKISDLPTMKALQSVQKKGQAYLKLTGGGSTTTDTL